VNAASPNLQYLCRLILWAVPPVISLSLGRLVNSPSPLPRSLMVDLGAGPAVLSRTLASGCSFYWYLCLPWAPDSGAFSLCTTA
jgi:hypothetical protein